MIVMVGSLGPLEKESEVRIVLRRWGLKMGKNGCCFSDIGECSLIRGRGVSQIHQRNGYLGKTQSQYNNRSFMASTTYH